MRGSDVRTGELFSYVDIEDRVPANHPLRLIRRIVNDVLAALDGEFGKLYAAEGRPSIAPERLLRALLLQAFYTIRSERQSRSLLMSASLQSRPNCCNAAKCREGSISDMALAGRAAGISVVRPQPCLPPRHARHTTAGRKSAFFRHPSAPGVWSEPSQGEVENCHGRGAGQLDLKLAR